jgi:nicotinamidase-related amidase
MARREARLNSASPLPRGGFMPVKNPDLHGFAPDTSPVVLLLIDVINDLEFPEGDQIFDAALAMAHKIAALKKRARQARIPTVYVNDNFGRWQSDFRTVIDHVLHGDVRGKPIAQLLAPDESDYFVLKPKHSAFFSTTLDVLLDYLKANTLILTGLAGNICVLFSANEAYMRDFNLIVPRDCIASNTREENEHALEQMSKVLKADTRAAGELELEKILRMARGAENGAPQNQQPRFTE